MCINSRVQAPCRGGLLGGQPLPNPLVGWHGLFSRASPARATRSWPHQCLTLPKAAASPEPNCVTVGTGGAAAEGSKSMKVEHLRSIHRDTKLACTRVSGNPEGNQRVPSTLRFRKFPGKPEGVWCSILFLSSFPRETREFP